MAVNPLRRHRTPGRVPMSSPLLDIRTLFRQGRSWGRCQAAPEARIRKSVSHATWHMERLYNCRIKQYPDGSLDVVVSNVAFGGGEICTEPRRYDTDGEALDPDAGAEPLVRRARQIRRQESAYEVLERAAIQDGGADTVALEARQRASRERAQRRARVAVRDLGLSNDWAYFVTLTLDPQRINRYDPVEVVKHLNHWLDNHVRRDGLAYVLVPEHHKDGAIHFHGFFNGALPVVDSGHTDSGGHRVFNLPAWGWGFSTAIELYGEKAAAVAYCCKYVAKQQEKIGGRWYYSGGKLRRPDVRWSDVDFDALAEKLRAEPFTVDGLPWSRFIRLTLQVPCDVNGPGREGRQQPPEDFGQPGRG